MNSHGIGLCVYIFSGTILDADSDSATNVKDSALQDNDWNKISFLELLKTPEVSKTN